MAIFTDTFDRANGSLGGNWTASSANVGIVNGWASCSSITYWYAYDTTISDASARQQATARVNARYASAAYNGPAVKIDPATNNGFSAGLGYATGTYSLKIWSGSLTGVNAVASVNLPYAPAGVFDIVLVWDNGHLTASIPGLVSVEYDSGSYVNALYMGMRGLYTTDLISAVVFAVGSSPELVVSPSPIGNYGSPVSLTFTGTNTAWNSTSPTFTVGNGTLSDQSIASDTSATATYDPATFLGTTTFTDPSTGATDDVLVTSDPGTVPPGDLCPFTEGAVDMVNDTAAHTDGDLLTTDTLVVAGQLGEPDLLVVQAIRDLWYAEFRTDVDPPSGMNGESILDKLWMILNGKNDPPTGPFGSPGNVTVLSQQQSIYEYLQDLRGAAEWDLQEVLDNIRGTDDRNLTEVYDAIQAGDQQAILDAIAALRGDTTSTVANIQTSMGQLRTVSTYTLQDVHDWIDAIEVEPTDLSPVLTAISNLSTQLSNTRTDILNEIAALGLVTVAINTTVGGIATTVGGLVDTAGDILDIVTNLQEEPPTATAPTWPGLANVTLGTELELSNGLVIDGPLHGLLFTITTLPVRYQRYQFGDTNSYGRVGAAIFCSDRGDYERSQTFSLDSQVMVPATMQVAASATIRLNEGWGGTVRGWTRSA